MPDIDWDNITYAEYRELCNSRNRIEQTIAKILMDFESTTELQVDSISMYKESRPVLLDDGSIREPDPNRISVQIRVPMRIIFPDD